MSEEEKEAIEYIKELIKPPLREEWDFTYKLDKTTAKQFKILVKCISKLQKEIEELKEQNGILQEELNNKIEALDRAMNNPDYICKDKIRTKIKELEKDIEVHSIYEENWNKIEVLKELLGDE